MAKASQEEINNRHLRSMELVKKGKIADSYASFSFDEKKSGCSFKSIAERGTQAGLLHNFQKIMDSEEGQAITRSENYGPYVNEVWPVVTAWYPDFPLKDLISVQDMEKPLAYLFFSKLLIGRTKSPSVYGDAVETPLGQRVINGKYPTGEISGEVIPVAQMSYDNTAKTTSALFAYAPLSIGTTGQFLKKIKIVVAATGGPFTYYAASIAGSIVQLGTKAGSVVTPVTGMTLDIDSGLFTYKEAGGASATTVTSATVNYVWNLDYATTENIPMVKEDIEKLAIEVTPRALGFEWTLFAEFLKKSQFGTDVKAENTKRIVNLLYQFQVRYILDDMYDLAEGAEATITIPSSNVMALDVKSQVVMQALKVEANKIEISSGRSEGNRIVVGRDLKAFLESLPDTLFKPVAQANDFSGAREIGAYGSFKVYYDPKRADNKGFMTYRGTEWYDAAYYLGVFMPIVPTDAVALGVTVKTAFVSMEAYEYHKPQCVIPLVFAAS